ncbi:MAG: iron-only hydrogenase system regulator [Ileibacterium sp.]|nr:iron-only hydrogenase system regulator [Ileibacterium sp.]
METRVAVISIIVENMDSAEILNHVLHEYAEWIIGRMGIPYKPKQISIVSVVIDAPQNVINALTGSLGRIDGITAKAAFSKA